MSGHDMKQIAYDTWRRCGHNLVDTVRVLKSENNFTVTRQTLASWRDEYDWEARAARAEAEEKSLSESTDISDNALLNSLLKQKANYERYFETLPAGRIDNQAVYAYSNLLKKIVDIRPKEDGSTVDIDRPKLFLEDMDFIAKTLKEIDPEGLKVLGRSIDVIIARFKDAHAKAA